MRNRNVLSWMKKRTTTIFVFTYGLVMGSSVPFMMTRCTTSGGCGNCGAFCSLSLSIVPLVLYFTLRGNVRRLYRKIFPRKDQTESSTGALV